MNKISDRDEMREDILDAAERLMAQYGYRKMTMTDLAAEAGIGVGTTYRYFAGKGDVALAVLERVNRRVLEQLQSLAEAHETVTARLRAMLVARVLIRFELSRSHPQQHREEFRKAIEAAVQEQRVCWLQKETELFAQVLREGQAAKQFEPSDADETAQTLMGATKGLMPRNLHPHEFTEPSRMQERVERLADLLLRAVRACPVKMPE